MRYIHLLLLPSAAPSTAVGLGTAHLENRYGDMLTVPKLWLRSGVRKCIFLRRLGCHRLSLMSSTSQIVGHMYVENTCNISTVHTVHYVAVQYVDYVICNIVTVSFYASLHRSSPHIPSIINITIIAKKSNPSISSIDLCKGIIGALEQASKLFWVAKLNAHHMLIISLIIYCKSHKVSQVLQV